MTSRALINPLPKKSGVTLRATIQNPRPRKYASDADRQKAFRDRQAVIQVRVAPKAVETFDEIAETLGYSRQEVVYALLMKGLMSLGNWETVGLPIDWQKKMPQFKLPKYENNPIMSPQGSREKDREAIRQLSEYLATNLENKSFKVEINQSGSIAGPSNYLRIYDPLTGRFFNKPIRISTHAKGSFESGNVLDIGTFLQADAVIDEALKMRALGPSKKFERDLLIEKFVEAKIAEGYKPKQAYRLAQEQFFVKENPMKRKATPAQLAARERFAAMARSGAFKRKAKAATKRKKNPARGDNPTDRERKPSVVLITNPKERSATVYQVRYREPKYPYFQDWKAYGTFEKAKAEAERLAGTASAIDWVIKVDSVKVQM